MNPEQGVVLINQYKILWQEKYGEVPPLINLVKEKWNAQDVIESVGVAKASELMNYYFDTINTGHPLHWFFYNFEKLDESLNNKKKDKETRNRIRKQTKERVTNG